MERKQFIKQAGLATIAFVASNKLMAMPAKEENTIFIGDTFIKEGTQKIKVKMSFNKDTIRHFTTASADSKILELSWVELQEDNAETENLYTADYKIAAVKKAKSEFETDETFICNLVKKTVKEKKCALPKNVNVDKIKLKVIFNDTKNQLSADWLDKNDDSFIYLLPQLDSGTCFLTTACVEAMRKADNCYELQTLRAFRDSALLGNEDGVALVKEYYNIAPQIVKAIKNESDSLSIFEKIFDEMIVPTVYAIEQRNNAHAIEIYLQYTLQLKAAYIQ